MECVASKDPWGDWKRVRHWLVAAVETADSYEIEDLYYSVMQGQSKLWLLWDEQTLKGAATSTIEGPTCVLSFAGGVDGMDWAPVCVATISGHAREHHGTVRTKVIGRNGWQKFLSGVGFKHTQSVFVREENEHLRHSDIQPELRRDLRGSV